MATRRSRKSRAGASETEALDVSILVESDRSIARAFEPPALFVTRRRFERMIETSAQAYGYESKTEHVGNKETRLAVEALVATLNQVESAVVRVASVVVVKTTEAGKGPMVMAMSLSAAQVEALNREPLASTDPSYFLEWLETAAARPGSRAEARSAVEESQQTPRGPVALSEELTGRIENAMRSQRARRKPAGVARGLTEAFNPSGLPARRHAAMSGYWATVSLLADLVLTAQAVPGSSDEM